MACRNNYNGLHQAGPADCFGHHFCIRCGLPLLDVPKTKGGKTVLPIVIGAVVLICLAVLLWLHG